MRSVVFSSASPASDRFFARLNYSHCYIYYIDPSCPGEPTPSILQTLTNTSEDSRGNWTLRRLYDLTEGYSKHRIHLELLVHNSRTSPQWLEPEERGNPLVLHHRQFKCEKIVLVDACKKDPNADAAGRHFHFNI